MFFSSSKSHSAANSPHLLQTIASCNRSTAWRWLCILLLAVLLNSSDHIGPADAHAADAAAATQNDPQHAVSSPQHEAHPSADKGHAGGHSDPIAPVLLAIAGVLFLAKISGDVSERLGMPAVLGELVIGVVLGNLLFLTGSLSGGGIDLFEVLKPPGRYEPITLGNVGAMLDMLARIGVILLLFEVGLESSVQQMMSVGKSAFTVAVLGVIAPLLLGYGAGRLIIPEQGWQVHLFLGATLCATSVGITARVLKDLGKHQQQEGQIILGAAVIDDVLGLMILAVVAGVIAEGGVDPASLARIIGLALGFLLTAVLLGTVLFTRPLFKLASYLRGHGMLVATALIICFGFSWLANRVGLAPIVGAFAAGLILERTHYRELGRKEHFDLEQAMQPLTALLVPIFFVQMGLQVDLQSFGDTSVLKLAGALTVVAIIGKQVCSWGVFESGLNKTAVGLGMIPRGEVGLIFAAIGKELINPVSNQPVINAGTYSAVVVMVIVTTMVTPPVLKWSLMRDGSKTPPDAPRA